MSATLLRDNNNQPIVIYPTGIPSSESFGIPALVGGDVQTATAVFYVRGFSAFGNRRNS